MGVTSYKRMKNEARVPFESGTGLDWFSYKTPWEGLRPYAAKPGRLWAATTASREAGAHIELILVYHASAILSIAIV
jgi:hypothetical protein